MADNDEFQRQLKVDEANQKFEKEESSDEDDENKRQGI